MPMTISMRDFIASGRFGPLRLGTTLVQARALLGPSLRSNAATRRSGQPAAWSYGNVHLIFHAAFEAASDILQVVDVSYFPDISYVDTSGVDMSVVDHWILRGDLALAQAEPQLQAAGLSYTKSTEDAEDGVMLVFESGVRLAFAREWSPELLLCSCFWRASTG